MNKSKGLKSKRLGAKSYRIAASTILSAYKLDKEDDTLDLGYDVKVSRYEMTEDELEEEHTSDEQQEEAKQELTRASTDGKITVGFGSDSYDYSVMVAEHGLVVKEGKIAEKKTIGKRRVRSKNKK